MSGVHEQIAVQAVLVQSKEVRKAVEPYIIDLKKSSYYPDVFADRSMTESQKAKIDPEADRFIYPDPPETKLQKKLEDISSRFYSWSPAPPLNFVYLIRYYLSNAIRSLEGGDVGAAVKYCGVYSHTIGDITEPSHAVNPAMVDALIPPPGKHIGAEIHTATEQLKGPVDISGYSPKLLGVNIERAEMGAAADLIDAWSTGASLVVPIIHAYYSDDTEGARRLSSEAQNFSAERFADFLHTVFYIAQGENRPGSFLDLCDYPPLVSEVDMLYRYRPLVDVSLVPMSGGRKHPLSLPGHSGKTAEKVHGLAVLPYLGPPYTAEHERTASIEYMLVPGAYTKFSARVGLNPLFEESMLPAIFSVSGDGVELAKSRPINPGDPPELLEADLGAARCLKLEMCYADNPTRKHVEQRKNLQWASHGVWAEPALS